MSAASAALWRRGWGQESPELQAQYLHSLFRNHLLHSPACIAGTLLLYVLAPVPAEVGAQVLLWVAANVGYHGLRMLLALLCTPQALGTPVQVQRWTALSVALQAMDGLLMLALALVVYPGLAATAQHVLLLVILVAVGATASTLAGRWLAMAVYVPPAYLGFAWSIWQQPSELARPLALLVLLFFGVYLVQARNHHRASQQMAELARRNGELAQALHSRNAELQEVAGARSRLLATVSHDLRQPAHAMGLLCERALLEPAPPALQTALRDLNELSHSLSASLSTLMDLTRLDAGLVQPRVAPLPLGRVMQRLQAQFGPSARHKGLALQLPDSRLWVHSDPELLHGVLANLVSNAIKYTRTGRVQVDLQQQGAQVMVCVRDTGPGIAPGKLDLIFKEFVRLEGADSGTEGLGLGLSIVRRYAALLGHALRVSSEPGQGSCFCVDLPWAAAAAAPAAGRTLARHDERLAGLRVLVVDNVDLVLSSMVRSLSAWGCEVHSAAHLAGAREVASRQALDVVITDFHLGDGEPDGLALIASLRALRPEQPLPALLMTGDVSGELEAGARLAGVDMLHKPVRPAVLQHALLELVCGLPEPAAAP